jgi:hypothetical protein
VSFAEPDCDDFPYAGWIPSVNGRLSFRHIGESRHPSESIYSNVTTPDKRYILAFQERRLSDQLFQFITHLFYGTEDHFYFVFCAETVDPADRAEEIKGTVYIYKSRADWSDRASDDISTAISVLNDARLATDDDRDEKIVQYYAAGQELLEATSDIEIDFILWRTGEIFFQLPSFREESLKSSSIKYAESQRQDFPKWIADQAYFFIRDISHRHQHHAPDSDTILILQRHDDEVKWRANILFSLHHYIIRAKRSPDTRSLYRCVGVLGYAASFRVTCDRYLDEPTAIPPFNEEQLLQSLNARIGELVQHTAEEGIVATLRLSKRTAAFALLAIVVAIVIMFAQPQIESGQVPQLKLLSQFAGRNFISIIWVLILLFLLQWTFSTNWFIRRRLFRDIFEASNVKRKNVIYVTLVIAAALLLFTFWVSYSAVSDLRSTILDLWNSL